MYAAPMAGEPGRLLFLRDTTLMTQPFDVSALQLKGEPTRIADDVMVLPNSQSAAFYVAGAAVLIYRTGAITAERSKLIWVGRRGNRLGEAAPEDAYSSMRISPDGTRAVVGRRNAARLDDQWVLEFARGLMSRLTFDAARETWPVWSPDGTEIVFAANPTGTYQLYRKATSGAGDEEQLGMAVWFCTRRQVRKRTTTFGRFHSTAIARQWSCFRRPSTSSTVSSPQTGSGSRTCRTNPVETKSTCRLSHRPVASGRSDIRLSAGRVEVGRASQLFSLAMPGGVASPYDVTADGQRFLAQELVPQTELPPLTVVTNWKAALPR
jgi:hypothetical protein